MKRLSDLCIEQKEYICAKEESNTQVYNGIYIWLRGIALFCIVVGLLGVVWEFLEIQVPTGEDDIKMYLQWQNDADARNEIISSYNELWKTIALLCTLVTIGFSIPTRKWIKYVVMIASLGIIGIRAYANVEEIVAGARYMLQSFLDLYNDYFSQNQQCYGITELDIFGVGETFFFIAMVLILLCAMDIFCRQSISISFLLSAATCMVPFIVGKVPNTAYTILMVLGIMAIWFLGKSQEPLSSCRKRGQVIFEKNFGKKIGIQRILWGLGLITIIIVIISNTLLTPCFLWFESHRNIAYTIIEFRDHDSLYNWNKIWNSVFKSPSNDEASMGLSGGQLGRFASIKGSEETDLLITVHGNYLGTVYLKGYSGSIYDGNSWSVIDSARYKYADDVKILQEEMEQKREEDSETITITVERKNANANYKYIPYFSIIEEEQYYLNGWLNGDRSTVDTYTVYSAVSPETLLTQMQLLDSRDWKVDVEESAIKDILSVCLEYPEADLAEVKADFMDFMGDSGDISFVELTEMIQNYLSKKAVYSTSPGKTPKGRDFVAYFLTEQQKGYCTHFASSAVLLYRMCGYPARYIEGYITKSAGVDVQTTVKNYTAHAWVEVYVKNLGWIPVEVTPGYNRDNIPDVNRQDGTWEETEESVESTNSEFIEETKETIDNGNQYEPSQDNYGESVEETNGGETEDSQGGIPLFPGGNNGKGHWNQILFTGNIMAVILIMLVIFMIRSYILLNCRNKKICHGGNSSIVLSLYKLTCGLASHMKITMGVECVIDKMRERLPDLEEEQLNQWKQIVEKAYFSSELITKEERGVVFGVYKAVYKEMHKKTMGTFLLRYIYCYPMPRKKRRKKAVKKKCKE